MLTGSRPSQHGAVGNGWLDRASGEVALWRQSNALVEGEKIYEAARSASTDLHLREALLVVEPRRRRSTGRSRRGRSIPPTAARSPRSTPAPTEFGESS
jgi:hypothetical protein